MWSNLVTGIFAGTLNAALLRARRTRKDNVMSCRFDHRCGFINGIGREMPFTAARLREKYCKVKTIKPCAKHRVAEIMGMDEDPGDSKAL